MLELPLIVLSERLQGRQGQGKVMLPVHPYHNQNGMLDCLKQVLGPTSLGGVAIARARFDRLMLERKELLATSKA